MNYRLKRNGAYVRHVVMIGDMKNNNRDHKVIDLEFETYAAAEEVGDVLDAEIIHMNIAKVA
jgi:molybdopterin synthase catalytic subunit